MKASTLFGITIALLIGLGTAAAARHFGWFDKKPVQEPPKQEAPQIMVLVPRSNLFEGIAITEADVIVRPLRSGEMEYYNQIKDRVMPPLASSVNYRIMAQNVEADRILLKEHFLPQGLPDPVSLRLDERMRAVNVTVAKDRSAGGVIRVGEHVDVYLTTKICDGKNCDQGVIQTACIARNCKIIMKRNNLWTVLAGNPDDRPVSYTLQANPYRAALLEFAQMKGQISLVATPNFSDPRRTTKRSEKGNVSFSDPDSAEYRDEDTRVESIERGELRVGDRDLERIYGLKPIPPEPKPLRVALIRGTQQSGGFEFPGAVAEGRPRSENEGFGYRFSNPSSEAPATRPGGG